MLEVLNLDQRIEKEEYSQTFPALQIELGELQRRAHDAGLAVVIAFESWEAAGKGTLINRMTQAIDPRGFKVFPVLSPNDNERLHPWMWRFWNLLPAMGNWALFDHSWYGRVLDDQVEGRLRHDDLAQAYIDIRQFEQQLTDSGVVLVKFFLHISRAEQKKRFEKLRKSAATAWKVTKSARRQNRQYDAWRETIENVIEHTDSAVAPWTVIEATQRRWTRVKAFRTVIAAIKAALADRQKQAESSAPKVIEGNAAPAQSAADQPHEKTILERVDLSLKLSREEYEEQLGGLQKRLWRAEHELYLARMPVIITYEGWDAGGKGGNIKRLTQGLDPRGYEVVPIAAPTIEEKAHHYLWRFWRNVPKAGHITVFDRTWYGRVLVERVEGFCTETEWQRAYEEINAFERQLADFGTVIVKFWLQIDPDEQLRRFQERQNTPYKVWKITDEDWRNREKRPLYEPAVVEMLERTSTLHAPWTILEANDKLYARVKALRTVVHALEAGLADRKK